jgi:hypothetical protein
LFPSGCLKDEGGAPVFSATGCSVSVDLLGFDLENGNQDLRFEGIAERRQTSDKG